MPLVLPEVVEVFGPAGHVRNPGVRVEDRQDLRAQGGEERRAGVLAHCRGVLFLHPGERVTARDVLKPEVGIGLGVAQARHARFGSIHAASLPCWRHLCRIQRRHSAA